jgi:hypothetical protein
MQHVQTKIRPIASRMQVKALPAFNPVAENRVKSRKNLLVSRVYERKRRWVK